jgi:ketosteroid isomerase-like protein
MSAVSRAIMAPLTGFEEGIDPREPLGALIEFYRAFNTRDLRLMHDNWVTSEEASMAHPLGGVRRGWADVREIYERIFRSAAAVNLEFHDYTIESLGDIFCAFGREHGTIHRDNVSMDLRIRTSRLFRFSEGRWRQIHHHGSIDNPELLLRYQAAIR